MVYFLCGGVFFFLLSQAKLPVKTARERLKDGKDDHSDVQIMKDIIKVIKGFEQLGEIPKKDVSLYFGCGSEGSINVPFNSASTLESFDVAIKNDYSTILNRMMEFTDAHIDISKRVWLVMALLDIIQNDSEIEDKDVFFIQSNGIPVSKKDINTKTSFEFQPFILGMLHYALTKRRSKNIDGKKTLEAIGTQKSHKPRIYNGNLGSQIKRNIDVSIVKTIDEPNYEQIQENTSNDKNVPDRNIIGQESFSTTGTEKYYDSFPFCLSKSMPQQTTKTEIIHRDKELESILNVISSNNKILIHGFGGIGKTSFLRLIFWTIQNRFQHVGWIEYRGDSKKSLLTDLDICGDITDQDLRWSAILKIFYNDKSSKILFIDNVDSDNRNHQDPLKDEYLQTISSFPNTTVILTSRLNELRGFSSFELSSLGKKENISVQKKYCADLFYTYYRKEELQKTFCNRTGIDEVLELIELAGFHTYIIELLSKGAKYCTDLKSYVSSIKEKGFAFPSAIFQTGYENSYTNAAEQIRKLFALETRTSEELKVLWDFSVLPNIVLTIQEVKLWLGYEEKDWIVLENQGWLLFKNGLIMHPLVKEAFSLNMIDGKSPIGTLDFLLSLLTGNTFIQKKESVNDTLRKLNIIQHITEYIFFQDEEIKADVYFYLGYNYFNSVKMLWDSEMFLKEALNTFENLNFENKNIQEKKGKTLYWLGYVQSATYGKRKYAADSLREALKVFTNISSECCSNEYYWALCHDHLGYVLSDNEDTYSESEEHLLKALDIWKSLSLKENIDYISETATTEDNIGFLYSKQNSLLKESEDYLLKALSKREKLYEEDSIHRDELSWTHHNLGDLYAKTESRWAQSEYHYRKALELRNLENEEYPGTSDNNIAWTSIKLGILLAKLDRVEEAKVLYESVLSIIKGFDKNHKSFFVDEIIEKSRELDSIISKQSIKYKDEIGISSLNE